MLLYATCSILKDENEQQLSRFLARTADAEAEALDARYGHAAGHGRQRLPGEQGMDGFFYALYANVFRTRNIGSCKKVIQVNTSLRCRILHL